MPQGLDLPIPIIKVNPSTINNYIATYLASHSTLPNNNTNIKKFLNSTGSTTGITAVNIVPEIDRSAYFDGGVTWTLDSGALLFLGFQAANLQRSGHFLKYAAVNVPLGATIVAAYIIEISVAGAYSGSYCNAKISGHKVDDTTNIANIADYQARRGSEAGGAGAGALTTAHEHWNGIPGFTIAGYVLTSPDISAVVQEIIDIPTWASGNHMGLFVDDHMGLSSAQRRFYSRSDGSYGQLLHIEYIVGTPTAGIPQFTALSLDDLPVKPCGASSGSGAQQTIAHGLNFTPTRQQIALTAGSATALPFHSAAPDATNIYVTATAGQAWYWALVGR